MNFFHVGQWKKAQSAGAFTKINCSWDDILNKSFDSVYHTPAMKIAVMLITHWPAITALFLPYLEYNVVIHQTRHHT